MFFKGKRDALSCRNYRGLKLQEHVMKILENILNTIIWEQVSTNNMQFCFMPATRQVLAKEENIYFAFVDLEKASIQSCILYNSLLGNAET